MHISCQMLNHSGLRLGFWIRSKSSDCRVQELCFCEGNSVSDLDFPLQVSLSAMTLSRHLSTSASTSESGSKSSSVLALFLNFLSSRIPPPVNMAQTPLGHVHSKSLMTLKGASNCKQDVHFSIMRKNWMRIVSSLIRNTQTPVLKLISSQGVLRGC